MLDEDFVLGSDEADFCPLTILLLNIAYPQLGDRDLIGLEGAPDQLALYAQASIVYP